ncbi:MAG: glutamine amidotransferase [Planctomycetia bacterium]|nr:glutamine amidotransferase [Planctomycetia bacterium]
MKTNKVCYLGDNSVTGPAGYLAGIMTHFEIPYDHIDSEDALGADFLNTEYSAYILSDYPATNFTEEHFQHLKTCVEQGAGLLMFGGWESYYGRLGEYHNTVLKDILPVEMLAEDDRRNYAQPVLVTPALGKENSPILAGLPWQTPPGVGGYNEFRPKKDAEVLLEAVHFGVTQEKQYFQFEIQAKTPLLVSGTYGKGKTLALGTDVAPHWVGGFVDWGKPRISQNVPGGDFVEIGCDYAKFFRNLVLYVRQEIK